MGDEPTAGAAFKRVIRDLATNAALDRRPANAAGDAMDAWFASNPDDSFEVKHPEPGKYQIVVTHAEEDCTSSAAACERRGHSTTYRLPALRVHFPLTITRTCIRDAERVYWGEAPAQR